MAFGVYADQKAQVLVHARTAAAAVTPPIEDAQAAFPLPKSECVRVWYGGEADPPAFEDNKESLETVLVGQITMIGIFLPITSLDEELAASLDSRVQAFGHALRTALEADKGLGGSAEYTKLEYGEPEIVGSGNTRYVSMMWALISSYVEYTKSR